MIRAIFLDRDGTLNDDTMYPHKVEQFKLLPGVIEGLKKLSKDYIFIIITNQSGIGRGIYKEEDFHNFNSHLISELVNAGIEIKKTYYCPHHPNEDCDCRKPNTKNLLSAAREFNIDIKNSWTIGDHPPDIQMGLNAGTKTIFMLTGHGKEHVNEIKKEGLNPDFIAENFLQAAEFIIKNDRK